MLSPNNWGVLVQVRSVLTDRRSPAVRQMLLLLEDARLMLVSCHQAARCEFKQEASANPEHCTGVGHGAIKLTAPRSAHADTGLCPAACGSRFSFPLCDCGHKTSEEAIPSPRSSSSPPPASTVAKTPSFWLTGSLRGAAWLWGHRHEDAPQWDTWCLRHPNPAGKSAEAMESSVGLGICQGNY